MTILPNAGRIPIAVLGGGVFTARFAEAIAALPEFPALDLRLHALDHRRLSVIANHISERLRALGTRHVAAAHPTLDTALTGAACVVLLVRVGGLAARAHDETFPRSFGLVGDEGVGVGGMANAWRTLPVLDRIADRIVACAPRAHVLNLIAPLGITTRLLVERGLRAVGLCELPILTLARWRAATEATAPELAYAGLNHLGFFWSTSVAATEHPVLRAAVRTKAVSNELLARFRAAPLHYYIEVFEPADAERLGRKRELSRAQTLAALQTEILTQFERAPGSTVTDLARRDTPWFDHALVPALHAALGGPEFRGPINLPGTGALDEAPPGVVVELMGRLNEREARHDRVPQRPEPVRRVLGRLARAEDCVYSASVRRERSLLADALSVLPDATRITRTEQLRLLDCICLPISPTLQKEFRP